ncbi:uncharacterized protein LOC118434415 isoform X1 [Folsomia candida]|uniref:uncharacterized protein LOC118434415 isoform X1 n=2 Tax=Folsomia candida TaxID=158441 RepID=UPI0016052546|nr:uncharacterized protein LOC118434415 isoform X1 [Folsomia candida]
MAKGFAQVIVVIKAILTRVIFATHGLVAIWRVTQIKNDPYYWYLCASILALMFEGVFTLTIKKNQEWKWFCPSVFFYLCSVVPAIWLLEVDKFDKKLLLKLAEKHNQTAINKDKLPPEVFTAIENLNLGVQLDILKDLDEETWATVIEQLLMLILIIGRWMLPKGGLTRDQLSQLLLVYIGTAADIIEFFDSFKDDKIASRRILCLLILSIWSWSLLQFTFVLTATKSRRTRITADIDPPKPKFVNGIYKVKEVCCSIDVWGILINIILQDAPFLIFRMLLITYYKIISYMNIFFTCKNTLVIILQFYRLYVVQQEKNKEISKMAKATVSGNLAKAVERAAFMGPTADPKIKAGRNVASAAAASGKKAGASNTKKGQQSSSGGQPKKHRSQDSITSQAQTNNRVLEAARRERAKTGRRKSLSTSNLPTGIEEAFIPPQTDRVEEDDLEMAMSGSVLSGTNDSQEEEESDVPLDEISFTSERPTRKNRKIRMSENPGIYKISGSRSSETSSHQGHGRCRQDTGYSSSSRDSANSSRRGRIVNGGSRTGRAAPSNANRSRTRNAVQRRRQIIAKELNSIEFGGMLEKISSTSTSEEFENERIFQRRAAICAVFSLFVTIFILCMVAIYGGINPRGLILRETFRVANSTKPKTTTTPTPPNTTDDLPEGSPTVSLHVITLPPSQAQPEHNLNDTNDNNNKGLAVGVLDFSNNNTSNTTEDGDDFFPTATFSSTATSMNVTLDNLMYEHNTTTDPQNTDTDNDLNVTSIVKPDHGEEFHPFPSPNAIGGGGEISAFTPSRLQQKNAVKETSVLPDFVRHSRRKVKRLYGFLLQEFSSLRRQ